MAKALGRRISQARRAKGLKQKHLAAALGVEPVTISRWETGAHVPPVSRLFDIAKALGIEPEQLVTNGYLAETSVAKKA